MFTDRQIEIIKEMQGKAKANAEIAKRLKTTIHYYRKDLSIAYELGKVSEEVYRYNSKSKVTEEKMAKKLGVNPGTIKKDIASLHDKAIKKESEETTEEVQKLFLEAQKRKARKPYNYFTDPAPETIEPELNINSKYVKVKSRNVRGPGGSGRTRDMELLEEYKHHILFKDLKTNRKESFTKAELLVMQTENRIEELRV